MIFLKDFDHPAHSPNCSVCPCLITFAFSTGVLNTYTRGFISDALKLIGKMFLKQTYNSSSFVMDKLIWLVLGGPKAAAVVADLSETTFSGPDGDLT